MKVSRTLLSLLLILILSFSILAACASEPAGTSSTPADISGTESAAEGFPLEEKNFGGKEITILCVDRHTYGVMQFAPDSEINANAVNDAVAERNNFIEEKYGLTIKTVGEDFPVETLRLAVTSGIDDYDMICDTILALMPLIPENLYLELDDYIDITNEWWDQNANELLTFNDTHYLVSGDAIITDDDYTYLLLFNKEMYANNSDLSGKYGDLYDLVREGKWTLDVMHEMMKAVSQPDIDGAWTENATYGMAGSNNIGNVFMNAGGYLPAAKTADGGIEITIGNEANLDAFGRIYDIFSDTTTTLLVERFSTNGWDIVNDSFREGRSLFYSTNASTISNFKNEEKDVVSFGVLPNPKFTEEQERYYHNVNNGNSSVLAISSTNVENLEATCYLLELLGYYGKHTPFKSINDAYYETTLKLQSVESNDDAEMLDIVFNNRIYDVYTIMPWGSYPTLGQMYGSVLTSGSNNMVSLLESKRQEIETDIQKTLDEFAKLN